MFELDDSPLYSFGEDMMGKHAASMRQIEIDNIF
jgi:hypothetical protein